MRTSFDEVLDCIHETLIPEFGITPMFWSTPSTGEIAKLSPGEL
jgi:hypothetical protein